METILQLSYFLWIKLFTATLLIIALCGIPAITAFFVCAMWPTKTVHLPYKSGRDQREEDVFIKPEGWQKFWITVVIGFGLIVYGTQLNWIFNMKPSRTFDDVTSNFFEGFQEHLKDLEKSKPPTRANISTELRRYELVSYNPPKHFYVTLEDVQTHKVFNHIYVSKHCNSAASNKIGDEYNIRVTTYSMSNEPNVVYFEFHDLYNVFCGS